MADLRIDYLVRSGLVPCIVACWGYFLPWMGTEKMKRHWRNLVARYGAYPVVWCLAGESVAPYYLSDDREGDAALQKKGWTELAGYVHEIDPYRHPVTIHSTQYGHDQVDDPSLLDLDMLQTGHFGYRSLTTAVDMVTESLALEPRMPVFVSEANYDGILATNRDDIQRFLFWSCLLSGAAGHTYGANGIWQVNTREQPFGLSPHGSSWGDTPWEEAYQLPASKHLGVGKALLRRYPWWEFEVHPEWIEPHNTERDRHQAYAAGIPGKVRVVFLPTETVWPVRQGEVAITAIEAGARYRGFYFDPKTGTEHDVGPVPPDADYTLPRPPVL